MSNLAEETEAILSDLPPKHRARVEGLAQQLRIFLAEAGLLGQLALAIVGAEVALGQLALAIVVAEVADGIPDDEEVPDGK